jgi:hypothetical protein
MATIGQRVLVESDTYDFEGVILSGLDLDGDETDTIGIEVDTDGRFKLRCIEDGEVILVNGWLASYVGQAD